MQSCIGWSAGLTYCAAGRLPQGLPGWPQTLMVLCCNWVVDVFVPTVSAERSKQHQVTSLANHALCVITSSAWSSAPPPQKSIHRHCSTSSEQMVKIMSVPQSPTAWKRDWHVCLPWHVKGASVCRLFVVSIWRCCWITKPAQSCMWHALTSCDIYIDIMWHETTLCDMNWHVVTWIDISFAVGTDPNQQSWEGSVRWILCWTIPHCRISTGLCSLTLSCWQYARADKTAACCCHRHSWTWGTEKASATIWICNLMQLAALWWCNQRTHHSCFFRGETETSSKQHVFVSVVITTL